MKRFHTPSKQDLLLMFYFDGQFPWNIPLLLYYPTGVMYEVPFRYETRWIPESMQNKETFLLREALIVMKFGELENTPMQQEYIPIRKVTITKCEVIGDYYFLYLKLGPFVGYEEGELSQFSTYFREVLNGTDNRKLVGQALLREQINYVSSNQETVKIEYWLRLARLLSSKFAPRMEVYENTVFLKLQAIYPSRNRELHPNPLYKKIRMKFLHKLAQRFPGVRKYIAKLYEKLMIVDIWGFGFKIGDTYTVKVIQFFGQSENSTFIPKDAILYLDLPKESFFLIRQSSSIIGHQDIHLFTFRTTGDRQINSSLVIKIQGDKNPKYQVTDDGEERNLMIPEIALPIQVQHSLISLLMIYVIPIIVFLVGSLFVTAATTELISLGPIISGIPLLSGFQFLNNPEWLAIQLSLGLLLQAIGLYILKREEK